jgi:hypothetical protein
MKKFFTCCAKVLLILSIGIVAVLLVESLNKASEKKTVYALQQYSPLMHEWHDVILIFGFMDNEEEAINTQKAFEKLNPQRQYKISQTKVPKWSLDRYRLSEK